ncbi:MAG: HRDC domain-containing protein [Phycisphaerales bacterium]|nr:HRDC domain-containing protein [Phycisphaerales bacterium]
MASRTDDSTPILISDEKSFRSLCEHLESLGSFEFDTEFVGEDQFRPEVCLIQVAAEGVISLIDPLAGFGVDAFWKLVASPDILKVVHAGPEDVAQTWHTLGVAPRNVFDLQIAAGFVGYGYPISLSRLARIAVNSKMHKAHTLSDWRKRPLHDDQILYAAEDVAYLRPIYDKLMRKLKKLGRVEWLVEECDAMCLATEPTEDREQRLKRLKGAGALSPKDLAIAYAILDEREKLATEYNRPVRTVIRDHIVVELARRGWTDVEKLRSVRGLNLAKAGVIRVAAAIEAAKKIPKEQWPELPNKEDAPQEDILIDILAAVIKDFCIQNHMSYGLLSKKQWLRDFVRSHTREDDASEANPLTTGWRADCLGRLLEQMIEGQASIRIERMDGTHRIVIDPNGAN